MLRSRARRWAAAAVALALPAFAAISAAPAFAKGAYDSAYGYDRTWNAGVRLVRVDLGLTISEKDESAGYLLFDYQSPESGKKVVPGSMEFIRSGANVVRVVVQIPQMPGYHEQVVVDRLARKLRSDYGEPPKRAPAPPTSDAGADGDADAP